MCSIIFKHVSDQLSCQKHGRDSQIGLDNKFLIALIWNMAKHEMTRLLISYVCWTWCQSHILVTLPLQWTTTMPTMLPTTLTITQWQPAFASPPSHSHVTSHPLKWSQHNYSHTTPQPPNNSNKDAQRMQQPANNNQCPRKPPTRHNWTHIHPPNVRPPLLICIAQGWMWKCETRKTRIKCLRKNPKTPNTHYTHTTTISMQEFGAFDIENITCVFKSLNSFI